MKRQEKILLFILCIAMIGCLALERHQYRTDPQYGFLTLRYALRLSPFEVGEDVEYHRTTKSNVFRISGDLSDTVGQPIRYIEIKMFGFTWTSCYAVPYKGDPPADYIVEGI